MFGKIVGAFAGSKLAQGARGVGGPTGAALGMGAAMVAKRLSLPALVAVTVGGYFAKKYFDKQETVTADPATPPTVRKPTI